jgi:hypothetical protein
MCSVRLFYFETRPFQLGAPKGWKSKRKKQKKKKEKKGKGKKEEKEPILERFDGQLVFPASV